MPGRALKVCGGAAKDYIEQPKIVLSSQRLYRAAKEYMVLRRNLVSALSFAQAEQ